MACIIRCAIATNNACTAFKHTGMLSYVFNLETIAYIDRLQMVASVEHPWCKSHILGIETRQIKRS